MTHRYYLWGLHLKYVTGKVVYLACIWVGLLLVAASIYYAYYLLQQRSEHSAGILDELVTLELELETLENSVAALSEIIETADDHGSELIYEDKIYSYTPVQVEQLEKELSQTLRLIEQQRDAADSLMWSQSKLLYQLRRYSAGSLVGIVCGLLLCFFGILCWYFKLDVFPDRRQASRD